MVHSATVRAAIANDRINPSHTETQVLAIGPWQQRGFQAALAGIPAAADWSRVNDIDEACALLGHGQPVPELMLLAQPLPGLYAQADLDRLQQLVPLARLVIIRGTWCEGELRTGTPPTGVIRLYWYELSAWWQVARRRREMGCCPPWSLPLDHNQAGRWSSERDAPGSSSTGAALLIDTADFAVYETLAAALGPLGISCCRQRAAATVTPTAGSPGADSWDGDSRAGGSWEIGIWDGGQLGQRELQRLGSFCRQVAGQVIALLDFPRLEHIEQAGAAGAAAVLAKPYIVEELVMVLSGSKATV